MSYVNMPLITSTLANLLNLTSTLKLNRVNDPGVLILSPFAGAGGTMHEALCVNPYEIGNVASMVHRALTMPIEEREVRMTALRYLEFLGKIISKTRI